MRERLCRTEYVSIVVLDFCVDRADVKKDGVLYLYGNDIFATVVIYFQDGVKDTTQNEMHMNFSYHANNVILPVSGDTNEIIGRN